MLPTTIILTTSLGRLPKNGDILSFVWRHLHMQVEQFCEFMFALPRVVVTGMGWWMVWKRGHPLCASHHCFHGTGNDIGQIIVCLWEFGDFVLTPRWWSAVWRVSIRSTETLTERCGLVSNVWTVILVVRIWSEVSGELRLLRWIAFIRAVSKNHFIPTVTSGVIFNTISNEANKHRSWLAIRA